MASPPDLNIPASTATVNVSIINTTSALHGIKASLFIEPPIAGHEYLAAPCYAFLIQNSAQNRTIVFDLGIRKDYWNLPPPLVEHIKESGVTLTAPKHVREILDERGVDTDAIEAVAWSHFHFDHTGDPSTFSPHTALIVGPGTKARVLPGYPADPNAQFSASDIAGREIKELDFTQSNLKIGRFDAVDYFGDGSFYFLNSPGHAVGHICGLARVTSSPDSFVLMAGDAIHHSGELRPHTWHPLPDAVLPHPFTLGTHSACPGELFDEVLRDGKTQPFYLPSHPATGSQIHDDVPVMMDSIRKIQEADARNDVLVVAAHDDSLLDVVEFFPETANDFAKKRWAEKARWRFLKDFKSAVAYDDKLPQ